MSGLGRNRLKRNVRLPGALARKRPDRFRPRLCRKSCWFAFLRAEADASRFPSFMGSIALSGRTLSACRAARLVLSTVAGDPAQPALIAAISGTMPTTFITRFRL
jgi:hypothetical protein